MSRIGRLPIAIPSQVKVELSGTQVTVRGPQGELSRSIRPEISVEVEDGTVAVTRPSDSPVHRSLHGLTRTLLFNMVTGVSQGYTKTLELQGVGYRAAKQGESLQLALGFSHPVIVEPPSGITFEVEGTNRVHIKGIDKEQVGQVAANIRKIRPPEPYKGKGIRYAGEVVRRKAGKAGKAR
jgi:large subunit ribosomal protein L6